MRMGSGGRAAGAKCGWALKTKRKTKPRGRLQSEKSGFRFKEVLGDIHLYAIHLLVWFFLGKGSHVFYAVEHYILMLHFPLRRQGPKR